MGCLTPDYDLVTKVSVSPALTLSTFSPCPLPCPYPLYPLTVPSPRALTLSTLSPCPLPVPWSGPDQR